MNFESKRFEKNVDDIHVITLVKMTSKCVLYLLFIEDFHFRPEVRRFVQLFKIEIFNPPLPCIK